MIILWVNKYNYYSQFTEEETEVKTSQVLAQGHNANKMQGWDTNLDSLPPKSWTFLDTTLLLITKKHSVSKQS